MNRSDLIAAIAEHKGLKEEDAALIVGAFFDTIKEALAAGDRVEIRGFGSFHMREYGGYKGRNPKSGDVVQVQQKRLPFFRVGKELKNFLNDDKVTS